MIKKTIAVLKRNPKRLTKLRILQLYQKGAGALLSRSLHFRFGNVSVPRGDQSVLAPVRAIVHRRLYVLSSVLPLTHYF
jgi:hypothetical protein